MNNEIIISNHNPQDITITQEDNQLIFIDGGGSVIGITDVLVNGESVVTNNIAYVIVPTKTSELENDGNGYHPFITHETDPTVPSYVKAITRSDINNWNNKQETLVSGTNIKTINNISLLGSGNINIESGGGTSTDVQINGTSIVSDGTANIQTKGAYNKNTNKIATENDIPTNTSDLNNDSNYVSSEDLSEVAFSGSYVSLSNVPTELSDFDNDLNFMTSSEVSTEIQTAVSTKQDTLVSGTNIKTINNTSLLGSGNINIGSGGTSTDVQVNGTSITSNGVANIITESAYNSSTNKIATKSDIPTSTSQLNNDSNYAYTNVNNNFSTSQNINGDLIVSGELTTLNHITTNSDVRAGSLELSATTPFIDFHYNNASSDFTSRLIEGESGKLTAVSNFVIGGASGEGGNLKIMKALRGFESNENFQNGNNQYTITLTSQQFNFGSRLGAILIVVGAWSASTNQQAGLYFLSWSGYLMEYSKLETIIQGDCSCTLTKNQDGTLTLNISGSTYNIISLF